MAAIVQRGNQLIVQHNGQTGQRIFRGVGVFNSTDATGTISAPGLSYITGAKFCVIGDPASDEILSMGGTEANGRIPPSSGLYTVKRTGASKTDSLKFFFELTGG